MALTVPDFPACRPLTELLSFSSTLQTSLSVHSTTRMSPLCTPPVVACIGKSSSWPPSAPQVPESDPVGGFSEDECSFTQSPGQSCLGRRVCRRARKSGRSDCCHISQILLSLSLLHLKSLCCQILLPTRESYSHPMFHV